MNKVIILERNAMKINCFKAITLFTFTDTWINYSNIIILAYTNRLYIFLPQKPQKFRTTGLGSIISF